MNKRRISAVSTDSSNYSDRNYIDPWDFENAVYIRGRSSDTNIPIRGDTYTELLKDEPKINNNKIKRNYSIFMNNDNDCHCNLDRKTHYYCDVLPPTPSPAPTPEDQITNAVLSSVCPYGCDSMENLTNYNDNFTTGDMTIDSCEDCSICSSSIPPPPPMMLLSSNALSNAGINYCDECCNNSFSISTRKSSTANEELAYIYESNQNKNYNRLNERRQRNSIALSPPSSLEYCEYGCRNHLENPEPSSLEGPHGKLLEPPRHPCRWGLARSGHVLIDYSNAWMSLARRIRPNRISRREYFEEHY